jgi:hypothetical protein
MTQPTSIDLFVSSDLPLKKGVGSQGDGTAQFVARSPDSATKRSQDRGTV